MDISVTHSCQCRINCGFGFPSLLARLMKGKKRRFVDAATQTDEDLIEVLVAKRWGERVNGTQRSERIAPPPPPPERKRGMHSSQIVQESKQRVGPFAPTVEELIQCRAALRPVNRKLTSSASLPPPTPPPRSHPPPKSASLPDNNSPKSITEPGDGQQEH